MSIQSYMVAELKARAAELRLTAHKEEELAFPLEGNASRARRNRRKNHLLELSMEYDAVGRLYEGLAARKPGESFTYTITADE